MRCLTRSDQFFAKKRRFSPNFRQKRLFLSIFELTAFSSGGKNDFNWTELISCSAMKNNFAFWIALVTFATENFKQKWIFAFHWTKVNIRLALETSNLSNGQHFVEIKCWLTLHCHLTTFRFQILFMAAYQRKNSVKRSMKPHILDSFSCVLIPNRVDLWRILSLVL